MYQLWIFIYLLSPWPPENHFTRVFDAWDPMPGSLQGMGPDTSRAGIQDSADLDAWPCLLGLMTGWLDGLKDVAVILHTDGQRGRRTGNLLGTVG